MYLGLEGFIPENAWMAFGYPDPSATFAKMIGADVTVVGMVGAEGFAIDYFLGDKQQCSYSGDAVSAPGVCPDSLLGGSEVNT